MTRADRYLIVSVFIICLFFLIYMIGKKESGTEVVVRVDGKVLYRSQFSSEVIKKKIKTPYGYNTIEIGEDYVRVIDADCPLKLDVKQGSIKNAGETIVCLPHRLVITIEGSGDMPDTMSR